MTNLEYLRTKYGIQETDLEPEVVNWLKSRESAVEKLPLISNQQLQTAIRDNIIAELDKAFKEHAKKINITVK